MADRELTIRLKLDRTQAGRESESFHADERRRLAGLVTETTNAERAKLRVVGETNRERTRAAADAARAEREGITATGTALDALAGGVQNLAGRFQGLALGAAVFHAVAEAGKTVLGVIVEANKKSQEQVDRLLKTKDLIREITMITGAKGGPSDAEVQKFLNLRAASGLSDAEAQQLSLEYEGAIGAAKGRNISAGEAERFRPMVARFAATAGGGADAAGVYGKLGGLLAGMGRYDTAEDLLAEEVNFNKIMSLGVGNNPTLIKQGAMVGGAFLSEGGKGIVRSPRELAALVATASRVNPETAAETLKSVTRVTRGFSEKWAPLLTQAGVTEQDSATEALGKLFGKMEGAERGGRSADAWLAEQGVDQHGRMSLQSMYNYRGMLGDVMTGPEGRLTGGQAVAEVAGKYRDDVSLRVKQREAALEESQVMQAAPLQYGRELDLEARRRLQLRGEGEDQPGAGLGDWLRGAATLSTGFGLLSPPGMTRTDVGRKTRIEQEKYAILREKGMDLEGRPDDSALARLAPGGYMNWLLYGGAETAYAGAGTELDLRGRVGGASGPGRAGGGDVGGGDAEAARAFRDGAVALRDATKEKLPPPLPGRPPVMPGRVGD